ncbi:hypothetical protein [Niveispirillum sp. KHB5.9]|uniref:hypothetical protein n=1 Tax=Niveispirillum sp. KHB5.9 TaxID=3400269 RepID=UPI003A867375
MIQSLEELDKALYEIVLSRMEEIGDNDSGAYSYYGHRIKELKCAFISYEWWLPHVIQEARPDHVVYAGSGFGYLAFALAMLGIPVHCYEGDQTRFNTLLAIRDRLSGQIPNVQQLVTATNSKFPDINLQLPAGRNLFLTANLGAKTTSEVRDSILDEFKKFDCVIVCERLFCGTYGTDEERLAMRNRIFEKYPSTRQEFKEYFARFDAI